jgi:hypothetical protein
MSDREEIQRGKFLYAVPCEVTVSPVGFDEPALQIRKRHARCGVGECIPEALLAGAKFFLGPYLLVNIGCETRHPYDLSVGGEIGSRLARADHIR